MNLTESIARLLHVQVADITGLSPVAGGSLTHAYRVMVGGQPVFVKHHPHPVPNFFETEAAGLNWLANTHTVHVPEVLAVDRQHLILAWIDENRRHINHQAALLGRALAHLHQLPVPAYGLPLGNTVGVVQPPSPDYADIVAFYQEQRFGPLLDALAHLGRLSEPRRTRLVWVVDHLDRWIDPARSRPSLLHGDLWSGNWIPTPDVPYLIDPTVYYGDRESELAFTELFGGFPRAFYDAYQEIWPLDPDYPDRRPLYQLYHFLVHLLLFGESYAADVDRILGRYAARG
jgi:fructosamine-3-kinase